jgi:hypothetical protein
MLSNPPKHSRFRLTVTVKMLVSSFGYVVRLKDFASPFYPKRNGLRNRNLHPVTAVIFVVRG